MGYMEKRKKDRRSARIAVVSSSLMCLATVLPFFVEPLFIISDLRFHMVGIGAGLCLLFSSEKRTRLAFLMAALALFNLMVVTAKTDLVRPETKDYHHSFSLAFYNLHDGKHGNLAERIRISSAGTDMVAVRGVAGSWDSAKLAENLSDVYPQALVFEDEAFLAKTAWTATGKVGRSSWFAFQGKKSKPFIVMTAFIVRPFGNQKAASAEVEKLTDFISTNSTSMIVVGGFGASAWNSLMQPFLSRGMLRTDSLLYPTWPAALPWPLRLSHDYAFYHPGIAVLESRTLPAEGLGHLPVYYRFGIK
ncbi:hypothetical protein FACS1894186_3890 [Alphaproteobacteria bacterium]|nr:hypothetical protein FACS1894186_3890 [Alphaproteobacteria bacterium]